MSREQIRCDNCGALMDAPADGRKYVCSFCNAEQLVAIDGSQIAAALRSDMADVEAFLAQLAAALANAVPERTRVQHDGVRMVHLEVLFEKDAFVAKRQPDGLVAQHKKMVRGVALKTVTHPLHRWVDLLSAALASHANTSGQVAEALAKRSGGRRPSE